MRLSQRKPPWQDDWTIEMVEAEHKSRPGVTSAWGWNSIETNWEAIAETARIMIALGDPEQSDRYGAHLTPVQLTYPPCGYQIRVDYGVSMRRGRRKPPIAATTPTGRTHPRKRGVRTRASPGSSSRLSVNVRPRSAALS